MTAHDKGRYLHFRLDEEMRERLRRMAKEEGVSQQAVLRAAIQYARDTGLWLERGTSVSAVIRDCFEQYYQYRSRLH